MSFIDRHLDGTPWALTMAEVTIEIAIGRARRRLREAAIVPEPQPDDDVPRKRCRDCERWRPLATFWKHPTTSDGLDGRCKDCKRIYDRKRAARLREAAGG